MRFPFRTHRFVLRGLNLERFLNLMQKQQIPLVNVSRQDARTLVCECYSADLAAAAALAQERGWRMEDVAPLGLSALLLRLKRRPGIPVGIVLMLVCVLVLSRFVWRVEIHNAGPYHADLVSFLTESGYHTGMPRSSVDAAALESALLHRYPEIAWFHVYVTSMTLVVEVTPGVPMPQDSSGETGDLLAARSGIVRSIRVFAGTPAVEPGDVVQAGDVLIHGTERARDGQQTAVRADGVVMARCWESFTVSLPLTEILSTETGRQQSAVRIHTPWFDWPSHTAGPDYLASNLTIRQTALGGVYAPVYRQILTWREVSQEYVPRDPDEVRKEAAEAALQQLKTALFGNEIIDKWVDYCMIEGDTLAVTANAELLVDIGVFSSP